MCFHLLSIVSCRNYSPVTYIVPNLSLEYGEFVLHCLSDDHARLLLDKELDWDNEFNNDLNTIADSMVTWETYSSSLKLTQTEIDDLKAKYVGQSPKLLRWTLCHT